MNNNDETLILKLITETYVESPEKNQPNTPGDLRNYFEKKSNVVDFLSLDDYLIQHDLKVSELIYQKNSKCYRLSMRDLIVDFPSNWSIFESIKTENLIYVEQSFDPDYLLEIFADQSEEPFNLALIREDEKVQLVYLAIEVSTEHVQWMRDYFKKKAEEMALAEAA